MKRIVNSFVVLLFLFLSQIGLTQNLESIKKEKPFNWSGSIGVNSGLYQSNGPNARQNPLIWNLSARLKGKFYGFDLPFSFSFGNNQFSFTRPYFQLGLKPEYKWFKLHIGTSSMKLSEYTLRGHRFDGVGVELTPGRFRFSAMKGRLRRARDYNSDVDNRFSSIVYKRTGTALKVGYGTEESYIDLIYFKAKDDPTSIKSFPIDTTILPAENAVAGLSTKIKIYQGINVIADGAISAYTRNQNSLENVDFTPKISSFFKTRQSTRINYAFNSGIEMNFSSWGLGLNYERIAPEFETMGAYFFANDRERISIRPNLRMANGKVRLNGNLGIETNNLLENRAQKTKQLTGMINLSYFNPNGLGFNANYSNLSVEQKAGLAELIDTFRVALVTKNITILPSYTWSDTSKSQSINLSFISQGLNDKNPFTRDYTQMNMRTINANYMLSLLAASASINFGLNYTHIELPSNNTLRSGFNLGLNKSFDKNLWTFGTSIIYNTSKLNKTKDGSVITANINLGYAPTDKSNFNLNCNLLRNNSDTYNNYTEFYGAISFTQRLK